MKGYNIYMRNVRRTNIKAWRAAEEQKEIYLALIITTFKHDKKLKFK